MTNHHYCAHRKVGAATVAARSRQVAAAVLLAGSLFLSGCTASAQSAEAGGGVGPGEMKTVTHTEPITGMSDSGVEGVLASYQEGDKAYFYVLDDTGVKHGLIVPQGFTASDDGWTLLNEGREVATVGQSYFFPGGWASEQVGTMWDLPDTQGHYTLWVVGEPRSEE